MKKYFMQETAEELKFGDMIVLDLSKEMENGHTKHHHLECKFIPELVPILLEEGVIKEEEVEDETPLDFQDEDENELYALLKEMIKANEKLYLTNAKRRMLYGKDQMNVPSRFIAEIKYTDTPR